MATATGGELSAPISLVGEVYGGVDAPVLEPISLPKIEVGTIRYYKLRATAPPSANLVYSVQFLSGSGTAPNVSVDSSSGVTTINAISATEGTYTYSATVTDTNSGKSHTRVFYSVCTLRGSFPMFDGIEFAPGVPNQEISSINGSGRAVIKTTPDPDPQQMPNANYVVDYTIWFNDPDDINGQISPLKITSRGVTLPGGISWSIVDDIPGSRKGVRVFGTLSEVYPPPRGYNLLFRVADPKGNVVDEDFYFGINGWVYSASNYLSGHHYKGLAERDVYYTWDEDLAANSYVLNLAVQDNDDIKPSGDMIVPPKSALQGTLTQQPDGTIDYAPRLDLLKRYGKDHFTYYYYVNQPGVLPAWRTNTVTVEIYYMSGIVSKDTGPSCGCGMPVGAGSGSVNILAGTFHFGMTAGSGGGAGCGCNSGVGGSAAGDDGTQIGGHSASGASPSRPRLVYDTLATIYPTMSVSLPSSALERFDGLFQNDTEYRAVYTFGSYTSPPQFYDATDARPGETITFGHQVDASNLPTGWHDYTITVQSGTFDDSGNPVGAVRTYTSNGRAFVLNDRLHQEFGNRWYLDVLDRLYIDDDGQGEDGVVLVTGEGETFYFKELSATTFEKAWNDPTAMTLTRAGSGTAAVFTLAH